MRSVVPLPWTVQPRASSSGRSAAGSPSKLTRITETPPSARLVVSAERTPGMPRSAASVAETEAAPGVSTWTLIAVPVVTCTASVVSTSASPGVSSSTTATGSGGRLDNVGSVRSAPLRSAA